MCLQRKEAAFGCSWLRKLSKGLKNGSGSIRRRMKQKRRKQVRMKSKETKNLKTRKTTTWMTSKSRKKKKK